MEELSVSTQENEAFVWMQGRLVDLLLRNFEGHFQRLFDEQSGSVEKFAHPAMQTYNEMAVLYYLREELFEEILPLIKRKLSFTAPQVRLVEELPARGRIDWVRTAAASWSTFPDEPPTQVQTNQRNRHFATPENLLTVCTLLEYQAQTQDLLDRLSLGDASAKLRHPLNEIVDRCRRELGFLQFAELLPQANRTLAGYTERTVEELEETVETNLQNSYNPAYARLLEWRSRLKNLRLLDRENSRQDTFMLGADPQRDNYLYQVWLFYEIGDYLHRQGHLVEANYGQMELRYRWGEPGQLTEYRLQHDQAIAVAPAYWQSAPGVRPDFYIHRANPQTVKDETGKVLWHAPGYVLDAKYYKPRGTLKAPSSPVKRMIADLQLTGERYGALLFAFQEGKIKASLLPGDREEESGETLRKSLENDNGQLYQISPLADRAQYIQPDLEIKLWRLRPKAGAAPEFDAVIESLLETAHDNLQEPVEIKCRAIFFDRLTANAHRQMTQIADLTRRDGRVWSVTNLDDLVLCPKPHVAPWRMDMVSVASDCCKNPRLCHIMSNPAPNKITPPVRLVALKDIQKAIQSASIDAKDEAEVIRLATEQVEVIVERYRDLIKPDLKHYDTWLQQEIGAVFFTTPLLTDKQRDTVRLACFLREQIKFVNATNYAGPALLFSGVLEELVRNTVYQKTSLRTTPQKEKTLGGVVFKKFDVQYDVKSQGLWQDAIGKYIRYTISDWLDDLFHVKNFRNTAAHEANLSQIEFDKLLVRLIGDKTTPIGVFNGLLSAWKGM
ncbi:MAG: hypothetical protein J0I20_15195 [Chloroflexi bacterium]|nr:hypothetical protein [Chloroflexota bacterium]